MMVMMMMTVTMVTNCQYLLTASYVPSTELSKHLIGTIPFYLASNSVVEIQLRFSLFMLRNKDLT